MAGLCFFVPTAVAAPIADIPSVPIGSLADKIITCESEWNPNAVGDHGTSFGLVQIHLPAHPEITKEQALDPAFSINYLKRELAAGHASQWSCYRLVR